MCVTHVPSQCVIKVTVSELNTYNGQPEDGERGEEELLPPGPPTNGEPQWKGPQFNWGPLSPANTRGHQPHEGPSRLQLGKL